jgi:transcription-repair coupling factor (superfamily II helicase)
LRAVSLPVLLEAVELLPALSEANALLPPKRPRLSLTGLPGSSDTAVIASLTRQNPGRFFVVIAESVASAERWLADIGSLDGERGVAWYPPREAFGEAEPHAEVAGERVETLERIGRGAIRVLLTTARALLERTQLPLSLAETRTEIRRGDIRRPEALAAHLESIGFERVQMVDDVAQFSVRGGIFDVYGFGMAEPVRMEFWGDEISELRHFDLATQRSTRDAEVALVLPVDGQLRGAMDETERVSIMTLFSPDTLMVVPEDSHVEPELRRTWDEAQHHIDLARRRGEDTPSRHELYESPDVTLAALARLGAIELATAAREESASDTGPATVNFDLRPPESIQRDMRRLREVVSDGMPTIILCDNEGQAERLDELLTEGGRPSAASLAIGVLHGGFAIPPVKNHPAFASLPTTRSSAASDAFGARGNTPPA